MSGRWTSSRRADQLPADWPRRRLRILRRDGYRCYRCGAAGCNQVDHKTPGTDHSDGNLGAICDGCHKAKSAAEGVAARRVQLEQRVRPAGVHPGLVDPEAGGG